MPHFRCTACGRRMESPVVIGAGDCPHCGGDVVFDLHGEAVPEQEPQPPTPDKPRRGRFRRLFGR
jgi:DNA-directed RNA polymerase subunit RPC12/RpoP